ncbi:MAG TPA: M50 family metallopeptidase [Anaerolineales bacterium]|nr:M50 family metallopeptidase [Anaerolineales bacterium]
MNISTLLIFIGSIVLLIIIHELGHFLAAKLFKVEVEEFGIGFPPRALKLFTWGETLFSLNWIPLGGFVRPKGENNPEIEGGLAAANPWVRIAVFAAGPIANLVTAVLLYTLIFARAGLPDDSTTFITAISPDSPAEAAGLMPGDQLVSVAGIPIDSSEALHETIQASLGLPTTIVVLRDGETVTMEVVPRVDPPPGDGAVGFTFTHPRVSIPLGESVLLGAQTAYFQVRELVLLPSRLIAGEIAPEEARLVGFTTMGRMFDMARESEAGSGMPAGTNTFAFFAYISLSLGILNLFPIPAVDGGRILFTLPEILFNRRIPTRFENVVNAVSFLLLLLLLIYVNIQDIVNPVDLTP